MTNIIIPIITTVLGSSLTYYLTRLADKRKLHEAEIKEKNTENKLKNQKRLMFYREMIVHLRASHDLFIDQCKIRNRLLRSLGHDPKTFDWEKLEETLANAYTDMNNEQRNLFDFIRSITENSLFKRNGEMLALLKKNPDYFDELPEFQLLQSHLELWCSKFEAFLKPRQDYCLIYVGVKEKKPFPTQIEEKVDQAIKDMDSVT
jgi:hypothetical protein